MCDFDLTRKTQTDKKTQLLLVLFVNLYEYDDEDDSDGQKELHVILFPEFVDRLQLPEPAVYQAHPASFVHVVQVSNSDFSHL